MFDSENNKNDASFSNYINQTDILSRILFKLAAVSTVYVLGILLLNICFQRLIRTTKYKGWYNRKYEILSMILRLFYNVIGTCKTLLILACAFTKITGRSFPQDWSTLLMLIPDSFLCLILSENTSRVVTLCVCSTLIANLMLVPLEYCFVSYFLAGITLALNLYCEIYEFLGELYIFAIIEMMESKLEKEVQQRRTRNKF